MDMVVEVVMTEMTEKKLMFLLCFQTCQIPKVFPYESGSLAVCDYSLPDSFCVLAPVLCCSSKKEA